MNLQNERTIWFRVCKSNASNVEMLRRVRRLYQMQYLSTGDKAVDYMYVADILLHKLSLLTNRKPTLTDFANDLHPSRRPYWGGDEKMEYWEAISLWAIKEIGRTDIKYIPNYIPKKRI